MELVGIGNQSITEAPGFQRHQIVAALTLSNMRMGSLLKIWISPIVPNAPKVAHKWATFQGILQKNFVHIGSGQESDKLGFGGVSAKALPFGEGGRA